MVGNGSEKRRNIVYCSTKIAPPRRSLLANGGPRPLRYSVVTENDFDRIVGGRRADGQRSHFIDGRSGGDAMTDAHSRTAANTQPPQYRKLLFKQTRFSHFRKGNSPGFALIKSLPRRARQTRHRTEYR